uniref:Uncharacterized protein n=1 Tax=Cajanus cajan TaxID=3821 RepID=A0A151QNT2_CAJCA|nr:hypothetical protein KK1_047536 [Cajanus cajan]
MQVRAMAALADLLLGSSSSAPRRYRCIQRIAQSRSILSLLDRLLFLSHGNTVFSGSLAMKGFWVWLEVDGVEREVCLLGFRMANFNN